MLNYISTYNQFEFIAGDILEFSISSMCHSPKSCFSLHIVIGSAWSIPIILTFRVVLLYMLFSFIRYAATNIN